MKKFILALGICLLAIDSNAQLYGMTQRGGASNLGVIFEWDTVTNVYTKKFDFDGTNGANPFYCKLVLSNGRFYGTAARGGANNEGVIFEWDPATNIYIKKIDFSAADGKLPPNSLVKSDGKFYGMTNQGGSSNLGVIFEWDPATNIYTKKIEFDGTNGGFPYNNLVLRNGKFYGMTRDGGTFNVGVIFEWDPVTNIYIKKIEFDNNNGAMPSGDLLFANNKFYGVTKYGGINQRGVIFEWDPTTNIYTKKIDFASGISSGSGPYGSLTLGGSKFYGMKFRGGTNNEGVLFEWDAVTNIYTEKISFGGINGSLPNHSLTYANGKLYGTAAGGGTSGFGVVFEWDPVTDVYNKIIDFNGTDGGGPFGDLAVYGNSVLPIKLLSFTASLQNSNNAKLQWQIATAEEGGKYELQKSTDERSFLPINLQTANATLTQFGYSDNALPNGTYYYRLKMTDKDGKITYSNVVIIKVGSKEQLISVYPNPVKRGESLQLSLQNIIANKIEIINAFGQVVYSNSAKQTGSIGISISSSLAPGQYLLRVTSENKTEIQKLLLQ